MLFDTTLMVALILGLATLAWACIGALRHQSLAETLGQLTASLPLVVDSFEPTKALEALQLPSLIGSILFMALFYIPYREELGLGVARDVLVVLLFAAFTAMLLTQLGVAPQPQATSSLDAMLLTGVGSTFLVVSISNFGGLGSSSKEVAIDLAVTLLIVAAAESLGLLWGTSLVNAVSRTALDLAVVYVLGFSAKILLFPSEILTVRIASPVLRTLFSLAALFVLLPFAGMALSLLGVGLYALVRMATGGPEIVFGFPPFAPELPLLGSSAYVVGLFATAPISALGILAATLRSVLRFADDQSADSEMRPGLRHRMAPLAGLGVVTVALLVMILF